MSTADNHEVVHPALYPGYPVADEAAFLGLADRFPAPPTTSKEGSSEWTHPNLVGYLLGRRAIISPPAITIGAVDEADRQDFSKPLLEAKRSATIHLPESDYAIPPWAAQFGSTALKIIEHEHATNPRADEQIAQIRCKQVTKGVPRGPVRPHLDMTGKEVEDYHIYLATNATPTTAYTGEFTYKPDLYPGIEDDPLEFFRDLDEQFKSQVENAESHTANPYDIIALHALTVHQAANEMPAGRTLFGIQFYRVNNRET